VDCSICHEKVNLDNHHIWSTCYGGPDVQWNKCKICPNCHRRIHTGLIIIEGWFSSTSKKGKLLVHRKKNEQSITEIKDPQVWLH